MKTKYLVIGASAAGLTAAQRLAQIDLDGEVICITDQNELPYNKCLLIDNLVGKLETSQLYLCNHSLSKIVWAIKSFMKNYCWL